MRVPGVDVPKGRGLVSQSLWCIFGRAGRRIKGSVLETGGY